MFSNSYRKLEDKSDPYLLGQFGHVHAGSGHFTAAVLVKFVSTCLTAETVEQEFQAEVTECQVEMCFPHLGNREQA